MPLLLLVLALSVYGYLWIVRRNSTLTRACKWRLNRGIGASSYQCAVCKAACDPGKGKSPQHCLRDG